MKLNFTPHRWVSPLRRLLFVGLLLAGSATVAQAQTNPFVHRLFGSNMVLQRDTQAPVWGWTTPGVQVNVTLTGTTVQTKSAIAGANGRWQVALDPVAVGGGSYTLTITGPQTVTCTNVVFGDVWLFAGQSNMAYTLTSLNHPNLPAELADSANYPHIRSFTVPSALALTPQANINNGSWTAASPSTTGNFSGTAYFTGREITKRIGNVPVGLLTSAWAGTEIKPWLRNTQTSGEADLAQEIFDNSVLSAATDSRSVSVICNAMIEPLLPFKIKGVVWYQGESNVSQPEQYERFLGKLRAGLREATNQSTLPFIVIQLADNGSTNTSVVQSGWAELREAQAKAVAADSNSRLVVIHDTSGDGDLHPKNKQDVGLRAALAAADVAYGQTLVSQGPVCTGSSVAGSTLVCTFSQVGSGLMVGSKTGINPVQLSASPLAGFAIAGSNKVFYAATAVIQGTNQVVVSSPSVPAPLYVRYAWKNRPEANLYNKITDAGGNVINGLPASAFRNDPVARLVVNAGTGTTTTTPGATVAVAATTTSGLTFANWIGDTASLAAPGSASTTATLGQTYVSVLARYTLTAAPSGLVAQSLNGQVRLTWNALPGAHSIVWRSTSSGGTYTAVSPEIVGATSFVDAGLTNGTTYYYKISAKNLVGSGPLSAAVSATPLASIGPISAPAAELTLAAPVTDNLPVFAPVVDYNYTEADVTGLQLPIFAPFDSTNDLWWDNLVGEMLQARLPYALFPSQGYVNSTDPVGNNHDPRQLSRLVSALQRAGADNGLVKFGCLADFPAGADIYNALHSLPAGTPMNLATTTTADWTAVFWDRMIKPWHDTVPSALWYKIGSRPLIHLASFESPAFSNQSGRGAAILDHLAALFNTAYGVQPYFALDSSWQTVDPTSINAASVLLVNPRFAPPSTASAYVTVKGQTGGIAVPGYVDPANTSIQISRKGVAGTGAAGDTLRAGLNAGVTANARDTILEGWNNIRESAGFYRSSDATQWRTPNQYIDIVRSFVDLRTTSLKLEAEAADFYGDTTTGNSGGAYRRSGGNLDVRALPASGWAVTNTAPNESLEYNAFQFSEGTYRFYLRYSSTAVRTVRPFIDGYALPDVMLPSTGGMDSWGSLAIGSRTLQHGGTHVIKIVFVDGGVDADWLFVRKIDPMVSFQSDANGLFLCAEAGGNATISCNRTYAGSYERFSINSRTGNGVVSHGDTITIQVKDGLYLNAIGGGGAGLSPTKRSVGGQELFTIVKVSGTGPIVNGDKVAIRTVTNGRYLTVASPTQVDATGTTLGTAQTFTVNLATQ